MRDAGFFFADALGLVRPTATGVKGLDAVGAVDASVLRPDVLLALTRANAGYSADATKPIVAPRRAGMQPPPSLLKEVFPWLKATLIGAFTQNTNNDDVQAARRVLQVLRELRVVLLQDVAFLLEVPSVAAAIKDSPIFGHALFASPEFVAFREDMRRAVGDSEIRAIESLCVAALGWTDERKQQMPDGAAERMLPTAPRLPSPSCTAVPQGPEAGALKRPLENEDSRTLDDERSALAAPTDPSVSPKRARRADSALPTPLGNRVFGEAAVPVVAGTADAMPEPVAATATVARMAQTIGELRSENDDLKAHLRRLEWSLSQHKAEMRSWMNRVEVTLRRVGSTHGAQPMPDSVISHHAERLGMAIHRPQLPGAPLSKYSAAASQHQQQQQQQPPYASGSYHEPASHRDSSTTLLPAHRDSMYERQPGMYSARQSPALAQRSQPASVEYRTAGPAGMSPRNPAYASRRAPGVEYADHHYGAQYPSAPSRQPPPSYGFPEHDGYSWRSDAQYASVPRGGRH
ncbi:hypothetical protein H4R19_003743 [Coemansia spiralis]|nr:hypothetical protein H4R19_003743 [Coemansia spiralis]